MPQPVLYGLGLQGQDQNRNRENEVTMKIKTIILVGATIVILGGVPLLIWMGLNIVTAKKVVAVTQVISML